MPYIWNISLEYFFRNFYEYLNAIHELLIFLDYLICNGISNWSPIKSPACRNEGMSIVVYVSYRKT